MIQNIIYDVGYVLVTYTWRQSFKRFGYDDAGVRRLSDRLFGSRDPESVRTYWEKYDMNEISDQEIEEYCYSHFPDDRQALEWFFKDPSVWGEYLNDLADTVSRMKGKGYGTYLLSNYPKRLWQCHLDNAPFMKYLDGAVVSWQEGCGKPDEQFYRILLERYSLDPDQCLFLDDRPDNTAEAEKLGIHTITLDTPRQRAKAVSYLDSLPDLHKQ